MHRILRLLHVALAWLLAGTAACSHPPPPPDLPEPGEVSPRRTQ
jgi:hypothetical protein